jgi:hypothetical protein
MQHFLFFYKRNLPNKWFKHIFCTYRQKWMQRGKKDSKNKIKRLRSDTDTRLHQVIREKGFYNMTLKERE